MTTATDPAVAARAELAALAPRLVAGYADALPRAVDVVSRRLLGAAWRERLGTARELLAGRPMRRYGFERVELSGAVGIHPAALLAELGVHSPALAAELADACVNLAVAYARRPVWDEATWAHPDPDEQMLAFERLATEGHPLHPCGRTRLGWRVADLLDHDQESTGTWVGFVAVRRDLHVGDDVGALLRDGYPVLPVPPAGYVLHPVHGWQLGTVLPERYGDLLATGALRVLPGVALPASPTTALRTVLLEPDVTGTRRYLKLSLDIQVTSTRRTISVASTRNGPAISAWLHRRLAGEPRVLLFPEVAGAAVSAPDGRSRDLSVIVRDGLDGRLEPGEVAVPGAALTARLDGHRTALDVLLSRYPGGPLEFLTAYAGLLLPPLLRLAAAGVGLEAHLQNSVPTFRDGVPHRIAFRDFAGLRLHVPRLRGELELWPGSVVGTDDADVVRAKLGYTAVQSQLGELVRHLVDAYGVDERDAWRRVRAVLDDAVLDGAGADPADHAFLTAPRVPHKALVRMRLADAGDRYVPVQNPLHDP